MNGTTERFKARSVAKDFTKKEDLDYFYKYALVARIATIRVLIILTSIYQIYQIDVNTSFFK